MAGPRRSLTAFACAALLVGAVGAALCWACFQCAERGGKTSGELARTARAALSENEARALGEQLLAACFIYSRPFDALRLIGEGADLDIVDGEGWSPLMRVSRMEADDFVAARLIAAGAKLDFVDKTEGWSALMIACSRGRAATAQLLVKAGANPNKISKWDTSALILACANGLADTAELLIKAGAALNEVSSEDGKSALDWADSRGLKAVAAAIRARGGLTGPAAIALLPLSKQLRWACKNKHPAGLGYLSVSSGALPQEKCSSAHASSCVASSGYSGVAGTSSGTPSPEPSGSRPLSSVADALRLIGEGADLDRVDTSGRSPLIQASMCLELPAAGARLMCEELNAVASRLVAAGAKLDLVDENGMSALIYACMWGRTATAQLLVAAGAALNQVALNGGNSALDWADEGGFNHDKVAEFAPIAAAIRARGGKTRAELREAATAAAAANAPALPANAARARR